ncbi:MAG: hypothetical protein ACYS8Z_27270, partial [Planctomycetota bacterium]
MYRQNLHDLRRVRTMDSIVEKGIEELLPTGALPGYYDVLQSGIAEPDEIQADVDSTMYMAAETDTSAAEIYAYRKRLAEHLYQEKGTAKSQWGRIQQRYRGGKAQIRLMDLGYDILSKSWVNPDEFEQRLKTVQQLQGSIPNDILKDVRGFWEKTLGATAEQLPIMFEGLKAGGTGAIMGGTAGGIVAGLLGNLVPGALGTPEEAVTVPIGIKTGAKIFGAGYAADRIRQLEAGGMFLELMSLTDNDGNRMDPKIAVIASHAVGAINGGIEIAEWAVLLKSFGITGQLFKKSVERVTKRLAAEGTITNAVATFVARYGMALGFETMQEIEQETTNIVFGELAKELNNARTGTGFKSITAADLKERYGEVTAESLRAFGIIALPGPTITSAIEAVSQRAETTTEAAPEDGDAAKPEAPPVAPGEKPAVKPPAKLGEEQATQEPAITKQEKNILREMGHSVSDISAMDRSAARKKITLQAGPSTLINQEAFTPPEVQQELSTNPPESGAETQNATNLLEEYWREYDERELEINVRSQKNQEALRVALDKT